jgi:Raf kinase inhibitor-like YbhB/YbcL family protein
MIQRGLVAILTGILLNGCFAPSGQSFTVGSSALVDGLLKQEYGTVLGGSAVTRSFPITWSNLPTGTKAIALVLVDKDFNDYVHWLATDIDPAPGGLGDGGALGASFPQGANDTSGYGYFGPMPSTKHVYRLTAYALSAPTELEPRFLIGDLQEAIKDKTLASATLDLPYDPARK